MNQCAVNIRLNSKSLNTFYFFLCVQPCSCFIVVIGYSHPNYDFLVAEPFDVRVGFIELPLDNGKSQTSLSRLPRQISLYPSQLSRQTTWSKHGAPNDMTNSEWYEFMHKYSSGFKFEWALRVFWWGQCQWRKSAQRRGSRAAAPQGTMSSRTRGNLSILPFE